MRYKSKNHIVSNTYNVVQSKNLAKNKTWWTWLAALLWGSGPRATASIALLSSSLSTRDNTRNKVFGIFFVRTIKFIITSHIPPPLYSMCFIFSLFSRSCCVLTFLTLKIVERQRLFLVWLSASDVKLYMFSEYGIYAQTAVNKS